MQCEAQQLIRTAVLPNAKLHMNIALRLLRSDTSKKNASVGLKPAELLESKCRVSIVSHSGQVTFQSYVEQETSAAYASFLLSASHGNEALRYRLCRPQ